jgi:hypothetical protein
MTTIRSIVDIGAQAVGLLRATVSAVQGDGTVRVKVSGDQHASILCDLLRPVDGSSLSLAADDEVLIWLPGVEGKPAVILGRFGPSHAQAAPSRGPQDEVVIEAAKTLTLRCGDGSITIREDGKILIKGKDLVSHATRLNRIKGGAVQIN